MRRSFWVGSAVLAATIFPFPAAFAAADDEARALMQQVRDAVPSTTMYSRVTLSSSRGWERELEIYGEKAGGTISTAIEVLGPQDVKDTRFLFFERTDGPDEQHMYVPLIRRAIRIADDTRKQAFLGSDFYVSDLVAPKIEEYDYRFVGDEEIDGRACRLVEAVPKAPDAEIYSKAIFAVDPQDLLVLRTRFFDPKGELLKVWTVDKLERVQGHWTIRQHSVENVQDKTTSTLRVDDIRYDVELPGGVFSRERLLR